MYEDYKIDLTRLKYFVLDNGERDYTIQPYIENIKMVDSQIQLINESNYVSKSYIVPHNDNNDTSRGLRDLYGQRQYYMDIIEKITGNLKYCTREYVFDTITFKVLNGELHSLDTPAIINHQYGDQYFINGKEYTHNEWKLYVRQEKINRLIGKSKTYF